MMHLGGWLILCGLLLLLAAFIVANHVTIYPNRRGRSEVMDDFRDWCAMVAILSGGGCLVTGVLFLFIGAFGALI